MKERIVIKCVVGLLATVFALAVGGTDALYVVATLLFFGICAAYAEWCERL